MPTGPVTPDQHGSLVDLLLEAHIHHREIPVADRAAIEAHLVEDLLAPGSPVHLLVASEGEIVVGLAALVIVPSVIEPIGTDRRQCVLKELYVRRSHRGAGVGEALVARSARFALDHGCGRMDWNVQARNAGGIRFYERLGATRVDDRLGYRMTRSTLETLAGSQN